MTREEDLRCSDQADGSAHGFLLHELQVAPSRGWEKGLMQLSRPLFFSFYLYNIVVKFYFYDKNYLSKTIQY